MVYSVLLAELMGGGTERYAASASIDRDVIQIAADSHTRASAAISAGTLSEEIVPVLIPQRKGDPISFEIDGSVRSGTDAAGLAKLRPAF